ncbi:importin-4 [Rhipicephalus sanguineus]|uniref:importin-4 n=1 Tax=Rhipicephalus sanguineus TaxID=34632 RepID=UPI001895F163|nr:importin-4 [Rhipicephalus sanguineus]
MAVGCSAMGASLESILLRLLVPDNAVIAQATQELKEAYRDPNIVEHLGHALCSSQNVQVRQYSAVLLRKKLYRLRCWKKLPLEIQNGLKSGLLQRITCEQEKPVVLAVCQLVAVIAKHECQRTPWTELQQLLSMLMHSKNVAERTLGFQLASIISSVAPEVFSSHFKPLFKFFGECLQSCGDDQICFYVIKSMTALVSFIGTDDANCFQVLIPCVMEVIRRLASTDEDKAVEALELFDELIDSEIAILLPHIRPLIKLCLEIAGDVRKGDVLRVRAMSVLSWMINVKKKAIVKHKLIPELLDVLFPIMEEVSPGDLDRIEDEEEDEHSCQSPSSCAAQLIDTMALHLPPEKLLPPLFQHVDKLVKSDNASQRRAAYLAIAVIAEGCSEAIRQKHLPTFVQAICEGILDRDVQVRNAALFALGQFADFLQPDMGKYANQVMPILLNHLAQTAELMAQTRKDPPNLSKTFYALETFCENLEGELVSYLPNVMQQVLLFLTAPSYRAKELAISAIGSAANATKEAMLPYFPQIIGDLKQYLTEHQSEQNATLRTQAIDTLGCLARTIGASNFLPMAPECVELGLHLINAVDDPDLRRSTYGMFASVSSVLKADMTKYLEPILDHMFTSLQSTEGVVTQPADTSGPNFQLFDELEESDDEAAEIDTDCAEDASDDDSDDDNEQSCTVANAYLEEKEDTCVALAEMSENIGPAFAPYLEKCFTEVYRMADYPAPDVQKAALSCLGQLTVVLFKSADEAGDGDHASISDASKAASMLISKLVEVAHIEREREVVLASLETLGLLINELKSAAFEGEEQLQLVVDLVKSAFNNELKSQCADEEIEEADEQDEAEYDGLLVQMAGDLVPAMAKALPAERFGPYMAGLLPLFMGKSKKQSSTTDRSYAVGTLAEVAEGLGQAGIGPFCRPLLQVFLNGMRDQNGEVRSNAVFGLGVLIQNAHDILQAEYPALLEALSTMLAREDNRHAKDNICGAVAKLILVGVTVVPVAQVFPVLLQQLPLQEDFEENGSVFHCICYLYGLGHEVFIKNIPSILRIVLRVIHTDQISEETRINLFHLIKSLSLSIPQEIKAILQACTHEEQQAFDAVLKAS